MIYLDMDGVLCDVVAQVEHFSGCEQIYNKSNYGTYFMQEASEELTEEQLFEYFSGYGFWAYMPKLIWADYIVDWAESLGDKVYILSRPWLLEGQTSAEACLQGKIRWISDHYPQFLGKLLFVDTKEDLASPGSILVDDNLENCETFAAAGGKTIFIPTPWGDTTYALHSKTGLNLINEVLECQTKVVESM